MHGKCTTGSTGCVRRCTDLMNF